LAAAALPDDPSLEQLKEQAKDLRDLARAGVPGALDLVGAHHRSGRPFCAVHSRPLMWSDAASPPTCTTAWCKTSLVWPCN
jgi:hypothetical protein